MAQKPRGFRLAQRTNSKLLIGLYGQSGAGKTFSALLMGRGLVGPKGRILMIDTESGRGELYADIIGGGYEVMQLRPPFTSKRYIAALEMAEAEKADCLIIDSASHEWEGAGGVLEQAAEIEEKSKKPGLHCWKAPKMAHQWFLLRLLQTNMHVILCLRAKFKSRQVKEDGKTVIVKDDHASPIQAEDFIYDMTIHGEVLQDHSLRLTKCSHPKLLTCFEKARPVTVQTGERLAEWCAAGGTAESVINPAMLAAQRGTEAFRNWWRASGAAERAGLDIDEMKAVAEAADSMLEVRAEVTMETPEPSPDPSFLDDDPITIEMTEIEPMEESDGPVR